VSRHSGAWTDKNNHLLQAMVKDGVSVARAAVVFKRSITSVRNQARKLGTPFPHVREVRQRLAESSLGLRG
jgi:hypothetical protein